MRKHHLPQVTIKKHIKEEPVGCLQFEPWFKGAVMEATCLTLGNFPWITKHIYNTHQGVDKSVMIHWQRNPTWWVNQEKKPTG